MWRLICNPPGYHSLLSVSDQTVGEEHLLNILKSLSHLQKREAKISLLSNILSLSKFLIFCMLSRMWFWKF